MSAAVPDHLIRVCFDIATHSLDFGSGFLDAEQVDQLRELAVLLGVDPWEATPPNDKPRFCGDHQWTRWESTSASRGSVAGARRKCKRCDKWERRPA